MHAHSPLEKGPALCHVMGLPASELEAVGLLKVEFPVCARSLTQAPGCCCLVQLGSCPEEVCWQAPQESYSSKQARVLLRGWALA